MKITVFNGSPKAERGNTHVIVEAFLQGAREAGAEVENIFLARKDIKHCRGCYACWVKTPGKCIHKDDMEALLPKVTSSDIIVFATPVYVDNVTGTMKNFMDRLIPLGDPHFEKDEHGECCHVERYKKTPKFVIISNCGFPEQSHFQVLHLLFKRVARNFHTEVIAEIYRGGGPMLTSSSPKLKPLIEKYKHVVKGAGKEAVGQLKLSEDTRAQLEQPLIPIDNYIDEYIKLGNKMWDNLLS